MSCVVPGCKSGYGGSNPEKLHFFAIPDDPASELLWKNAIKRKDRYAKSGKVVCQKHFLPEQILWERKLLGPDGSDLGMSQLDIPYLEDGVVPSQFSWNEEPDPLQTQTPNLLSTNGSSVVEPVIQQPVSQQQEVLSIKQENESTSTINENPSVEMQVGGDTIITEVKKDLDVHLDVRTPFGMTELYTTQLNLPPGWMKDSTFWDRRSLMIYFKNQTFKIENAFRTVTWKAVTIKDDMSVEVSILGEPLALENFDISNVITSVEQLQTLLFTIHPLKVCSGCTAFSEKSEIERLYGSTLKRDVTGTWRHAACSLLLSNTTTCQPCQSMRRRVESKIRKLKHEKIKNTEKEVLGSQDKKNESSKVKSKCRCAIRARDESRKAIKKLEAMLRVRQLPVKLKNNVC